MKRSRTVAVFGVTLALVLLLPASALATTVLVRIEGIDRTLLPVTQVQTPLHGWITKDGTPSGKCPAKSAAGALDVATHHHWGGSYSSSLGELAITSILGETHSFTSPYYWSIWVDDRYAQAGACELTPRLGDQVLFAAVPVSHSEYPLGFIRHTARAKVGQVFTVQVVWFNDAGRYKPLADVHVSISGSRHEVIADSHGIAHIVPAHAGTMVLRVAHQGYIRAEYGVPVSA
jgi:hypothetical protein